MLCFLLLKNIQSQLKTVQPQLETLRRNGNNKSCIHTKSQLALWQFSIGKSDNLGFFWKLFAAIANAAQLFQMLWAKIDVCNLKSIRPNSKSIGAEKSDCEKWLQLLQALYNCPSNITFHSIGNVIIPLIFFRGVG